VGDISNGEGVAVVRGGVKLMWSQEEERFVELVIITFL
jgi:hypothetical protein